jgi:hypothetical protein
MIRALAPDPVIIYESPSPKDLYAFTPGICVLKSGRLLATMEICGPKEKIDGLYGIRQNTKIWAGAKDDTYWQGRAYTSDDKGLTWTLKHKYPMLHQRAFKAGKSVYIIGALDYLWIIRSDDEGETWTEPCLLDNRLYWGQSAGGYVYKDNHIYITMGHVYPSNNQWPASTKSLVSDVILMRGNIHSDLTKRENWTFASELNLYSIVDLEKTSYFKIPFYAGEAGSKNQIGGVGFSGETSVIQIKDPRNLWFDDTRHTFHIWGRVNHNGTGYAYMIKVVENPDGTMTTMTEKTPFGKDWVFVPCPGGHLKFFILYDELAALYWLLSTQATDSMIRPETMEPDRYHDPANERQRLVLHYSKNCIDWCFAGLVDKGGTQKQARHYASMAIDGDNLYVISRSGNEDAADAHNGNLITFHTIKNFRQLVY